MALVSITKSNRYVDVDNALKLAIERSGELNINDGDKVLIKVNLCSYRLPSSGAVTHPLFLDALLKYLREKFSNLEIIVIESDATSSYPDITLRSFNYDKILDKWGAKWYNLTQNGTYKKKIKGVFFDEIEISNIFKDYDYFISLSKLKTHSLTKITASLKNQFGCLPEKRKSKYHKNIHPVVVDCNIAMKPDFSVVDGILSMIGGVAIYGTPIYTNFIITGHDPVAVDSCCSKIFGISSGSVEYIKLAEKAKLGTRQFECTGEDIKNIRISRESPFLKEVLLNFGRNLKFG